MLIAKEIHWDTDGLDVDLPTDVPIPPEVDEEDIADWLSDKYGFCVFGFTLEKSS